VTHVSLFTGIGGLDLAAEWAGFETILQVENDSYATKVLKKHWPEVPRIADVREVNSESISRPVTVISGGFPCQPFSAAGKRRGTEDDRYLWPEMLRVIRELGPAWVVGENVSGLLSLNEGLEFETIATQLEDAGYEVLPLHYPAAGVGAPHKRDRVFIVAHRNGAGLQERRRPESTRPKYSSAKYSGENVADAGGFRRSRCDKSSDKQKSRSSRTQSSCKWSTEPSVGRVAHGIPNRVDRLRCLGNAVVPQQAYPVFKAIAEVEKMQKGKD
jgi:DNA (cytosine-5)-methyltransferase 1